MTCSIHPYRYAMSSNDVSTSFTAKTISTTEPATRVLATDAAAGAYDLTDSNLGIMQGIFGPKYLQLMPFGGNDDGETFDMQLWGWSKAKNLAGTADIYIPQLLVELNVTVEADMSGTSIAANMLMAKTIVIAKGDANAPVLSYSASLPASILVHTRGCRYIEFEFDRTGNDASNCLWRAVDS